MQIRVRKHSGFFLDRLSTMWYCICKDQVREISICSMWIAKNEGITLNWLTIIFFLCILNWLTILLSVYILHSYFHFFLFCFVLEFLYYYWVWIFSTKFIFFPLFCPTEWSDITVDWTCLRTILKPKGFIWWRQRNWMSAGMFIHMKVAWFFLLLECSARPSMDFRYVLPLLFF